ncbi:MAG: hypothetical protein HXS44_13440 [Theionarchaea archaeon]|nr:hypothetical protein [Theionarchaea archaeon]
MKDLITLAFRQVRGIRNIYLPEESSRIFLNIVENLQEVLAVHHVDHILVEGDHASFYVMFSKNSWIGVTTDKNVNEVLIRVALERAIKFLEKHNQVEQRIKHIQRDIEEYFLSIGVDAAVRKVDLSLESDSVTGVIHLSAREGRTDAVREQVNQFLEKLLPYFIKNKIHVVIEKQTLLDRITRDQLLRIIRRVERL